jgi:hypothetical protein
MNGDDVLRLDDDTHPSHSVARFVAVSDTGHARKHEARQMSNRLDEVSARRAGRKVVDDLLHFCARV